MECSLWWRRWCEGEQMWGEFYTKSQMAVDGIHQILFTLNSFCLRPPAPKSFQRYFRIFIQQLKTNTLAGNCEKFAVWNRSLNQLSNIWLALLEQDTICPERDRVWNWIFLNSRMSWLLEMYKFEWIIRLRSKLWVKIKFLQLYYKIAVIETFRLW